jgi:type I restriction enzyme S subunit
MSGRKATTDIRPGYIILSVGMPSISLPKKWRWTPLLNVAELATGHTPSRKIKDYWGGEIPWMAVGDARKFSGRKILKTKEYTNLKGIENSAAVILPINTVCLSRTASIGYSVILGKEMATSQGFVNWICSEHLNPRFLQLLFIAEKRFLFEISEGTAHTTIYFPEVKAFHIGLPPRAEQDRIVAKLDSLFGQLESINNSLEHIPTLLKNFRKQVLTQAVTGKLTEEWRVGKELEEWVPDKNDQDYRPWKITLPNDWKVHSFKKTAEIQANLQNPDEYPDHILVAPNHIEKYTGRLIQTQLTKEIAPKSDKHYFEKGSIIYSKIRPYLSKLIIAEFDGLCSADMYPIKANVEQKYLFYYMLSQIFLQYVTTAGERSVLPKVNQKGLNNIPVPVPPIKEQLEIVKRIENLFAKANAIEKHYKALKTKIEHLPQTILLKAFKGELVQQLESDGDARELLKEIGELKKRGSGIKMAKKTVKNK